MMLPPIVLDEDVRSEAALYQLEHNRKASKRIIAMTLRRGTTPTIDFSDYEGEMTPAFSQAPVPPYSVLDRLITWAEEQDEKSGHPYLTQILDYFLEDPEERLEDTLSLLQWHGVITPEAAAGALPRSNDGNFAALVRRQFEKYHTLTWDYLEELARREYPHMDRVDTVVRTTLRQIGKTLIYQNGSYTWPE